jgi:hypothetical protein
VAALPAVPATLRVALLVEADTVAPCLTRFFVTYTGTAPSDAQLTTFNGAVASAWGSDIAPLVDTNSVLIQIESIDLTSSTSAVATTTESTAGTRSGTQLPAQLAMVTSYEIARRYRGGHPRGYWRAGITTDLGQPRAWATGFVTSFQSGVNSFFTAVLAATWSGAGTLTQSNVSYYEGFTPTPYPPSGRYKNVSKLRVGGPVVDTVTSRVARSSVGTQRRREAFVD